MILPTSATSMTHLSEFDPFAPSPDDRTLDSLPAPLSPQAKLGDLSISAAEEDGGRKGFVDEEGEQVRHSGSRRFLSPPILSIFYRR